MVEIVLYLIIDHEHLESEGLNVQCSAKGQFEWSLIEDDLCIHPSIIIF